MRRGKILIEGELQSKDKGIPALESSIEEIFIFEESSR